MKTGDQFICELSEAVQSGVLHPWCLRAAVAQVSDEAWRNLILETLVQHYEDEGFGAYIYPNYYDLILLESLKSLAMAPLSDAVGAEIGNALDDLSLARIPSQLADLRVPVHVRVRLHQNILCQLYGCRSSWKFQWVARVIPQLPWLTEWELALREFYSEVHGRSLFGVYVGSMMLRDARVKDFLTKLGAARRG
jgi:hypothetical protein